MLIFFKNSNFCFIDAILIFPLNESITFSVKLVYFPFFAPICSIKKIIDEAALKIDSFFNTKIILFFIISISLLFFEILNNAIKFFISEDILSLSSRKGSIHKINIFSSILSIPSSSKIFLSSLKFLFVSSTHFISSFS